MRPCHSSESGKHRRSMIARNDLGWRCGGEVFGRKVVGCDFHLVFRGDEAVDATEQAKYVYVYTQRYFMGDDRWRYVWLKTWTTPQPLPFAGNEYMFPSKLCSLHTQTMYVVHVKSRWPKRSPSWRSVPGPANPHFRWFLACERPIQSFCLDARHTRTHEYTPY